MADKTLTPFLQLQGIQNIRNDIIKSLSLYYYTFVDLLEFKDNVCDLLTTIDICQVHLDIVSPNFYHATSAHTNFIPDIKPRYN